MSSTAPLISLENAGFTYPGAERPALEGISLEVRPGEHVCIVGGNGSGKSTLVQIMDALLQPTEGRVRIGGIDPAREAARAREARRMVATVFQNPDDQMVTNIVQDDVAFGPENLGFPRAEITRRVRSALERAGIAQTARMDPSALSGGQRQCAAIAGALAMEPRALLLDEPTSMLDRAGRALVMDAVSRLHGRGIAVVHVTHAIDQAMRADRVVALRAGRIVWTGAPDALASDPGLVRALGLEPPFALDMSERLRERGIMVPLTSCDGDLADALARQVPACGRRGARTRPAESARARPASGAAATVALERVSFSYGSAERHEAAARAVRDLTLALAPGTVTALVGRTGAGKSTVAALACALKLPDGGRVLVGGTPTSDRSARATIRAAVGYVGQFPERQLFAATVADDIAFGPRNLGIDEGRIGQLARDALARCGARDPERLLGRSPHRLSGGERRMVALAGVLAMDQDALVLDETGAGLDAAARASMRALIGELAAAGKAILLVTHDMDDAAELADTVAVLDDGQLAALGSPREIFGNPLVTDSGQGGLGLGAPRALAFARMLEGHGVDLAGCPLTRDELVDAIADAARKTGGASPQEASAPHRRDEVDAPAAHARACGPAGRACGPLASRGRVVGDGSPIHRLDPRVKVVGALAFMASCLVATGAAALALAASVVVGLCLLARIPPARLARQLRPLASVVAISALINLFCIDGGPLIASWGPVSIHQAGADAAVLYAVRFLLMFAAGTLLVLTTTPVAIADALRALLSPLERVGVRTGDAAMTISIALRFVPILARDARDVADAQTARGAGLGRRGPLAFIRACIPMAAPLFASALRHAENLGRAMDARGYTGDARRTVWRGLRLDARPDGVAIALLLAYLAASVALAVG